MPGLLLLLTRTEPGLAPVPGTSPRGQLAVGSVLPTLEQLPVNDPFLPKVKCRRLLRAPGQPQPVWGV